MRGELIRRGAGLRSDIPMFDSRGGFFLLVLLVRGFRWAKEWNVLRREEGWSS